MLAHSLPPVSFQAGHTGTINTCDRSTFLFLVLIFLYTLFWLLDLEVSGGHLGQGSQARDCVMLIASTQHLKNSC